MRTGRFAWTAALAASLLAACVAASSREPATVVIVPAPPGPVPTAAPVETAVEAAASASPEETERAAADAAAEVDRRIAGAVKRVGPEEIEVARETVADVLDHSTELTRGVRIRPVHENGALIGLALEGVRSDSWLGALGLADGDVLQTINGFSIVSPDQALEAYPHLRGASRITLGFRRDGKARVIRIRLR